MIARLKVMDGRIVENSVVPLLIGRDAVPRIQTAADAGFAEVAEYLRTVTREANLTAEFAPRQTES
jgi:histone H3/H4